MLQDFDIEQILECGQVFRWTRFTDKADADLANSMSSYLGIDVDLDNLKQYMVYSADKAVFIQQIQLLTLDDIKNLDIDYENITTGRLKVSKTKVSDLLPVTADRQKHPVLVLLYCSEDDFNYWKNYFDLQSDYSKYKAQLPADEHMSKAICYGQGIRILRQELFETIVSFITSANNNITRIQKIVFALSQNYGKPKQYLCFSESELEDTRVLAINHNLEKIVPKTYNCFPAVQTLAEAEVEYLRTECNLGYRDRYIQQTAQALSADSLDSYCELPTEQLHKKLLKLQGVGDKVAECIMLFAAYRLEVFPKDVWIQRLMENLYIGKTSTKKQVQLVAEEKFADLAGLAQQYLFYYGRSNNLR